MEEGQFRYRGLARQGGVAVAILAFLLAAAAAAMLTAPWVTSLNVELSVGLGILATVSATCLAPVLWFRMALDGGRFRVGMGALSGAATVCLVHTIVIEALLTIIFLQAWMDGAHDIRWEDLLLVFTLPLRSLVSIGFLTLPLGVVAGSAVTLLCKYRLRRQDDTRRQIV